MQPEQQDGNSQPVDDTVENLEMYQPTSAEDTAVNDGVPAAIDDAQAVEAAPVHWVASEYISEEHGGLWFLAFAVIVIALVAIAWYLQAWTFVALIVVMAATLLVLIKRPSRNIEYTLSIDQGLYVGERLYHFSDFKAFGLIRDRDQYSIMLIPTKRFQPGVSVYFPSEVGEQIVDILGSRLPMHDLKLDAIDIVIRKLRL